MEKIVKEIIDNKVGKKWQIIEQEKYGYTMKYYERFGDCWHYLFEEKNYSKEVIKYMFDIEI